MASGPNSKRFSIGLTRPSCRLASFMLGDAGSEARVDRLVSIHAGVTIVRQGAAVDARAGVVLNCAARESSDRQQHRRYEMSSASSHHLIRQTKHIEIEVWPGRSTRISLRCAVIEIASTAIAVYLKFSRLTLSANILSGACPKSFVPSMR